MRKLAAQERVELPRRKVMRTCCVHVGLLFENLNQSRNPEVGLRKILAVLVGLVGPQLKINNIQLGRKWVQVGPTRFELGRTHLK